MSNGQSQIGFEQLGLGSVLKRYRLLVPPNQRDYAWTEKHVTKLLQDLTLAITEDEPQHFLGTIVTIPTSDGVLEVVDGQQRLATTALILAAMRQVGGAENAKLAKALETYIIDIDTATLELAPKMQLNAADNQVFHELLESGSSKSALPNRESHRRLIAAFDVARKHLITVVKPIAESERPKVFVRWMNFIEHKARAILLIVPDSANAFKMFETLNDRGLKVSQSDLVKNYVFGQADKRLGEAQQIWSYIKGALETLDEDEITMTFLRQALIAMNGYITELEVYERVQKAARGSQSSIALLSTLEILSNDYVAIASADSEKWNGYPHKTRELLRVLDLFDIKPFRPLLLAIANKFEPAEAADAFEKLVSYGVRLIIAASTRTGSVEQPLAKAAKQVFDGEIVTAKSMSAALLSIVPADEVFQQAFEIATVSQAKFARYYLRSVELAAKGQSEPWLIPNDNPEALNLEHILPQKPMANWPEYDEDQVRVYSKRIGNLALLQVTANSDLKSAPFSEKVTVFGESELLTTKMISEQAEWAPKSIIERQKALAKWALTAWPL
ncbi:DUF262 domain-containing protein [Caulobacter hibisci]|uniref:DUF262 domain-containing protein n=1 Tax=Caulobacter hibisci TaxID=2035993 RepID=A0ABS0SZ24_9CAUL|nr:DUF262 domain-containing protein [Caulobacter hibisci]MBI1684880.1 DUF262 domain-containing protein [Caulobacter hibisci]